VDKLFFTGGHLQQRWHFTSILETRPFNSGTRPLDDCCKLYFKWDHMHLVQRVH